MNYKNTKKRVNTYLECVWEARFASQTHVYVSEIFFFFLSSRNFLTFLLWTVHKSTVHGSHKIHFSTTFSLKMGPTILFTYLKIILLQCFSVFSFSFQFSAVSKRTLNVSSNFTLGTKYIPGIFRYHDLTTIASLRNDTC